MVDHLASVMVRDAVLTRMAWGVFLIGAGAVWLLEQAVAGLSVDGAIPLLAGGVLLGLNAVRASVGLPVRQFTVGLGIVLALVGVGDILDAYSPYTNLPVVPLALITIGGFMLYGALRNREGSRI